MKISNMTQIDEMDGDDDVGHVVSFTLTYGLTRDDMTVYQIYDGEAKVNHCPLFSLRNDLMTEQVIPL